MSHKYRVDKKSLCAIALILLMTTSLAFVFLPSVSAHAPPWTIPTFAYLTVAPNPIGLGQSAYLVMWTDKYPLSAGGDSGDRWENFTISVTAPDGAKSTLGPFVSDPIASYWIAYTPNQVGTYQFQFSWPGQVLRAAGYTGIIGPNSGNAYVNDTYLGSHSEVVSLVVQQDPVPYPESYPLPTGYWQRPIEGQNTEWGSIASNWLSGSAVVGLYQPYGLAPSGAHIVWSKPLQPGGVVGPGNPVPSYMTYYSGTQYENKFPAPIILNGYLYYSIPLHTSPKGGGTACVDLQTGELIWWKNISINFAQLYNYQSPNQHGMVPGLLWSTGPATSFGGGGGSLNLYTTPSNNGWLAYDPTTGEELFNITNVPSGTTVTGSDGSIDIYRLVVSGNQRYVAMWNNTAAVGLLAYPNGTGAWQWRPLNQPNRTIDASNAYSWNVTVPWLPNGATIVKVLEGDMILGRNGSLPAPGASGPYTMWALNLDKAKGNIGDMLWMKTYPAPDQNMTIQQGQVSESARVFTMYLKETMQWIGYSLDNGAEIWGPTPSETAWNYYAGGGGSITSSTTAYGMLYSCGYGGILYGYNMTTGKTEFTYGNGGAGNSTNSGFATVYGNYPLGIGAVADGKIYLYTAEHSEDSPYYPGALLRCVDAYTGKELWTVPFAGVSNSMAIADGYLIGLNLYDMQIYCFGKGQTATTVSAPNTAIPLGTPILVQGTVTDQSPGVTQTKKLSPNSLGTPAISDADQGAWMAYTYMQKPIPETATGVPVTIFATDPSGHTQEIGKVTSDMSGTYAISWTPPSTGIYTITATFDGTNNYFNSYTATCILVTPAPAIVSPEPTTSPTASPTTSPDTSPTTSPSSTATITPSPFVDNPDAGSGAETLLIVGAAVVIIVVVAVAALLLRKRA